MNKRGKIWTKVSVPLRVAMPVILKHVINTAIQTCALRLELKAIKCFALKRVVTSLLFALLPVSLVKHSLLTSMADADSLYELSSDQDVDPDAIDGDVENDDTADDG